MGFAASTPLASTDEMGSDSDIPLFDWRLWNATTEAYAHRRITFQKDRFWALAGVAGPFSQRMGSFHAGLWSKHAAIGLLWKENGNNRSHHERNLPIPSWSWASINENHIVWAPFGYRVEPEWFCDVNKIETFGLSSNPFGEIAGGYICIGTKYTEFILQTPTPQSRGSFDTLLHQSLPAIQFSIDIADGEGLDTAEDKSAVVGCLVARFKEVDRLEPDPKYSEFEFWMLVLKRLNPVDAQNHAKTHWQEPMSIEMAQSCYRRVGVVMIKGPWGVTIDSNGEVANQYRESLPHWDEMEFTII
jgi:hypothetical protein